MDPETQNAENIPPEVRRRRVKASNAVLVMQEAAAQVRNDANSGLRYAHEKRQRLPSVKELREQMKRSATGAALGRAKQVQYAIDDAVAMFRSFRTNFFEWVKDPESRTGKPMPPRYYRRGQRARLRFDYQEIKVEDNRLSFPESVGVGVLALVERDGEPLLLPGDRLVEVRIEPCRSRKWVYLDMVIRRAPVPVVESKPKSGSLFVDLGVARLLTCLDDKNLVSFFVDGGLAKAILQRGAKQHAKLRREAALGVRHGKARAGALAARSARQMEDLMKKVALLIVTYAREKGLSKIVVGHNKAWKQEVDLGKEQNQLFTFIPHGKLIRAIKAKCARAGIEFTETEESFTSKTDHLAKEPMEPKPEGYKWLGSRCSRGSFRSSTGIILQADVNGCLGIGRKVGGNLWLDEILERLGSSTGTRLVPRRVHVNGCFVPVQSRDDRMPHPRGLSSRMWIRTKVVLAKAGLIPDLEHVASATRNPQVFPKAA